MSKLNNSMLVKAITKMKNNPTHENKNAAIEEIVMNAKFYVPGNIKPIDENAAADKPIDGKRNAHMNIHMISDSNKNFFFPAFTSLDELYKWKPGYSEQTLTLNFDDFTNLLNMDKRPYGFVIDPFGVNLPIFRDAAESFRVQKELRIKGSTKRTIKDGTKVRLSIPKDEDYPHELVDALKTCINGIDEINAAYFCVMTKDEGESSYLLTVDLNGNVNKIIPLLMDTARPLLKDKLLDLIPANTSIGKNVIQNFKPVYTKNK